MSKLADKSPSYFKLIFSSFNWEKPTESMFNGKFWTHIIINTHTVQLIYDIPDIMEKIVIKIRKTTHLNFSRFVIIMIKV